MAQPIFKPLVSSATVATFCTLEFGIVTKTFGLNAPLHSCGKFTNDLLESGDFVQVTQIQSPWVPHSELW